MSLLDKFQWCGGSHGGADYFTDKLTRIYSLIVFVLLAIILSLELHRDDAFNCWCPDYFTASHMIYTNKLCSYNHYYYGDTGEVALPMKYTLYGKLHYFPWVLLGQAFLFIVPGLLWRLVSDSMYGLYGLVRDSTKVMTTYEAGVGMLITSRIPQLSKDFRGCGLSILYLMTKLLYFITCMVQLSIMYAFFGFNFVNYFENKYEGISDNSMGNGTSLVMVHQPFPRVVTCEYKMRIIGVIYRYTVQCTYAIVDSIEVCIYVAWIWILVMITINAVCGIYHLMKLILSCGGITTKSAVRGYLSGYENYENAPMGSLDRFVSVYVKPDVAFVLNMIGQNGSQYAVHWAVRDMWNEFMTSDQIHVKHEETRNI